MQLTRPVTTLCAFLLIAFAGKAQVAIGRWRDHFPYLQTRTVVEGNGVAYCASRNAVFSLNPGTNEMERYTKVNALSDVDITALGWNTNMSALVVGYSNGNIDLVMGERSVNLGDIKRSSIIGDKRVYSLVSEGPLVYATCGFGIVLLDLERLEVKDTWLIGPNAAQLQVNALTFYQDSIYAATETGLYSAWRNASNLAAFTNWHKRTDVPRPNGPFNDVEAVGGRLFLNWDVGTPGLEQDTIYYWENGWQRLADAYGRDTRSLGANINGDRLVVGMAYEARQYDNSLNRVFQGNSGFILGGACGEVNGGVWVASENLGLVRCTSQGTYTFNAPSGPRNTGCLRMDTKVGHLMTASGSVGGNWTNTYSHQGVHYFADQTWRTITEVDDPLMNGVNGLGGGAVDQMAVVMDPDDPGHGFTGSYEEGVLEWRNGVIQNIWNASNSSLGQRNNENFGVVDVAGLDIDKDGNLWVSNANTIKPISVRTAGGTWRSFDPSSVTAGNNLVSDIMAARENNLKWLVRPRGNGLLVFDDGGTIDDIGDDQFKVMTTSENQGKLPSLEVASVAEDLDGEVWVGTGKGVAVFYNPDAIFSGENFDCQQILIEQDGNVQILLETEVVSAIEVDGANRKWLGTQTSGAYLVSADGTQQLAHFTAENSPLPSNTILSIAVDGVTGEVFFGTDQGIISYRGEATDGGLSASCATVFPNPVRETYTGPVAITGLVANSDVRITDVAGNLVYKMSSLGGQAIWPGTDLSGQRVGTGVYLVLATDPTGSATCNTKVLVLR